MLLENILLYLHPQGHCSTEAFTKKPPQNISVTSILLPQYPRKTLQKIPGLVKTSMEQQ